MRVYSPTAGAAVTPEIPVAGPGYPLPASAQGSKLRYASLLEDYAMLVAKKRPAYYVRFTNPTNLGVAASDTALNGTVTAGTGTPGLLTADPDGAILFNGTTTKISVPDNTLLQPLLSDFTWEFIFRTTMASSGYIFHKGASAYDAQILSSDHKLYFHLRDGANAIASAGAAVVASSSAVNDGKKHKCRVTLSRGATTATLTMYIDGTQVGSATFAYTAATSLNGTGTLWLGVDSAGTASFYSGVLDEVAFYPANLGSDTEWKRYSDFGPKIAERWLDALGTTFPDFADAEVDSSEVGDPSATPPFDPYSAIPFALVPRLMEPGGVFEIYEKQSGELVRIAFANDVATGIEHTVSLQNLDSIRFTVSGDRFSVPPDVTPDLLTNFQKKWNLDHASDTSSPYDKANLLQDHVYVKYTSPTGREWLFRVVTLDRAENNGVSGTAIEAGMTLSDYLTQYKAGRSIFVGMSASEIAPRILRGEQALRITNRRFTADKPPRMNIALEVPDMTPSFASNMVKNSDFETGDLTDWDLVAPTS